MLNSLQAGRFFAATAVVIHHVVISITAFVGPPPAGLQYALSFGYLGVDFFFILSGFIIHYTMTQTPRHAGQFAYDRFTRIMLPYWPIGIVLAIAYTSMPALSDGDRSWSWLSTITLFPTDLPPALSVAWTLQHELLFYLLYAALFFSGRVALGLTIWASAIIITHAISIDQTPLMQTILAPVNIEFIAGVIASTVFIRSRPPSALLSVSISAILLLSFVAIGAPRSESWLVGFAIAALLPWICHYEQAGSFKIQSWLVWGGAASYAIYLVHNPLLSLTSRMLSLTGFHWPFALITSVIACLMAGALYHVVWERPVMRLVKRSSRRMASAARP